MSTFELHNAIVNERNKLRAKNHPRIKVDGNKVLIDAWCDGDKEEAYLVILMTRKYRTLVEQAYAAQQDEL